MTDSKPQDQPMTATPATVGKEQKKPVPTKVVAVQSYIYIGPTLPPALAPLPQYICFALEIPPQLDPLFKKCPAISELIVPTSDLARARLAMAKAGTREHSFSVAVQKFIAGPPLTIEESE